MTFGKYVKDKIIYIIVAFVLLLAVLGILKVFNLNPIALALVEVLILTAFLISFLYGFFRKRSFYNSLLDNLTRMDKAYLVLETIEEPGFLEGKLLYDALYDIDKSMTENVGLFVTKSKEFSEYIEMWIHEVKLPLSAISLKLHNLVKSGEADETLIGEYKKMIAECKRIEEYVNQVLYFVRSENAEKDYHIQSVAVSEIIHDIAMTYRENLRDAGLEFVIGNGGAEAADEEDNEASSGLSKEVADLSKVFVNTDKKWLVFIMGQYISNSIKYKKGEGMGDDGSGSFSETGPYVKIFAKVLDNDRVALCCEDNGLGIPKEDMPRIFDKSFTGKNGLKGSSSTGMGLYIVKELAGKLGHEVNAESEEGKFTRLSVILQNCNIK